MSSIHKFKLLINSQAESGRHWPVLLALLSLTGCQLVKTPPPMRINPAPIATDQAMQHRNWAPSTASYANGVTVASPTGLYVRADPRLPTLAQGAVETPLFLGQVILLPADLLWDPPWKPIAYPRAQAPSSYTAAPPTNTTY